MRLYQMRDKIIYGTVRQYHIWFIFLTLNPIFPLDNFPSSVYNPIIRNKRWWRRVLESFSERQRSVWAANGTRTFHFGDKDEESFGICPLQETKDGRKAIWVVSRVLSSLWGWRAFFIIRILTDAPVKLGGTARKEKLVPWDVFSFCVF